jgi:sugar O-acyltransferase (sialic acid O-acetyltransferase NeuD family)
VETELILYRRKCHMKEKVIIFGVGSTAELAHYYFTNDSQFEVVAFTVDSKYINSETFCGLPVYDFENIETNFSVEDVYLFVAIGIIQMNKVRTTKIKEAKNKNFRLASYISTKATVFGNIKLGEHCFILEDNTIQPFVEIGDNNILWSGNHIGHHSKIGNNNFITSHVVVSGNTTIGNNCFIGVNASIRDGIKIANESLIGAGSFISRSTEEKGVYKTRFTEKSNTTSDQLIGM